MSDEEFVLGEYEPQEIIGDGEILAAEVASVEVEDSPFKTDAGQPQKRVNFRFVVTEDGDYQGRNVYGGTPTTFTTHPDCKLRVWVQEILGQDDLDTGFSFKPETLVGCPVRILVGVRERKGQDGSPVLKNFVSDVIRSTQKSASSIF